MNRKTDPEDADYSHARAEVCLKEAEWKIVNDFIASTKPYRDSLDASINGIRNGMWAVALVVLIPFFTGLVWIGGIEQKVQQNTKDIADIETDIKEINRQHREWALERGKM